MPIMTSLVARLVVVMTTQGAANDEKVDIITALGFSIVIHISVERR